MDSHSIHKDSPPTEDSDFPEFSTAYKASIYREDSPLQIHTLYPKWQAKELVSSANTMALLSPPSYLPLAFISSNS